MGNANSLKHHLENAQKTGVCSLTKRGLSELPGDLTKVASQLRTLDVSENKLSALPESMQAFPNLKHLNCGNNKITRIPESLGELTKLETLVLSDNRLTSLPSSLSGLRNLKTLNASNNQLPEFPACLLQLPQLDVVDLSRNKITSIPDSIRTIYCSEINLNENQINHISEAVCDCPRLKTLRLESNCLSLADIPSTLLNNSGVSLLALDGNVFEVKELAEVEGYDKYMERFTATKKKMF